MIEETQETLQGGVIYTNKNNTTMDVAIYFDYIDEESSTVEASITDNYTESNFSLQDHIAIKPRIYRLRGCIGEVVYQNEFSFIKRINGQIANNPVLRTTIEAMRPIAAVSGIVSSYTQAAINLVNQIESSVQRYKKIYDRLKGKNVYNNQRQETVVAILNQMLRQRIPVSLMDLKYQYSRFDASQTYTSHYYIQSVSAHQGANDFISDIEVTIKEFRIATTKTAALDPQKFGEITVSQIQEVENIDTGIANGQEISEETKTNVIDTLKANVTKAKDAFTNSGVYKACTSVYNSIKDTAKSIGEASTMGVSMVQ